LSNLAFFHSAKKARDKKAVMTEPVNIHCRIIKCQITRLIIFFWLGVFCSFAMLKTECVYFTNKSQFYVGTLKNILTTLN
jgi:hypothetical protein